MKLTPEQKAWFEYGRSRGWLKAHRSKSISRMCPIWGFMPGMWRETCTDWMHLSATLGRSGPRAGRGCL